MNNEQLIMNNELVVKTAKKRVAFKKHVTVYILVNLFLWLLFFFLFRGNEDKTFFYVILFILLTWSILVIGHYFYAMKWNKKMLEKEIANILKESMQQQELCK